VGVAKTPGRPHRDRPSPFPRQPRPRIEREPRSAPFATCCSSQGVSISCSAAANPRVQVTPTGLVHPARANNAHCDSLERWLKHSREEA